MKATLKFLTALGLAYAVVGIFPVGPSLYCNAQTTVEVIASEGKKVDAADKALNQTYQTLREMLDPKQRQLLKESEQAWVRFRDAEQGFAEDMYRDGTHRPVAGLICRWKLTEQRTQELSGSIEEISMMDEAPFTSKAAEIKKLTHEADAGYRKADRRLNEAYRSLKPILDAQNQRMLADAQRKWIVFRDKEAEFHAERVRKAGLASVWKFNRLASVTNTRADYLSELLAENNRR